VRQPITKPTNQSIHQSINQSTNQSIIQSIKKSANQSDDKQAQSSPVHDIPDLHIRNMPTNTASVVLAWGSLQV
jgi:hypothetical protein